MRYFLINGIIASFLMAVMLLSGCSQGNYLIKVDDTLVSRQEFELYLMKGIEYYEEIGGEDIWETEIDGEKAEDVLKNSTVDMIVRTKVQVKMANKKGIKLTDEEIQKAKEVVRISMQDSETGEKFSKDILEKFYIDDMLKYKLYQEETKNMNVSNESFNIYLNSLDDVDIEELTDEQKKEYMDEFLDTKKNEIYDQKYNEWERGFKVETNTDEIGRIEVKK